MCIASFFAFLVILLFLKSFCVISKFSPDFLFTVSSELPFISDNILIFTLRTYIETACQKEVNLSLTSFVLVGDECPGQYKRLCLSLLQFLWALSTYILHILKSPLPGCRKYQLSRALIPVIKPVSC